MGINKTVKTSKKNYSGQTIKYAPFHMKSNDHLVATIKTPYLKTFLLSVAQLNYQKMVGADQI